MDSSYTKIVLKDVEVSVRVGLASWERETSQPLLVTVELYARADDYLDAATPTSTIDCSRIYDVIQSWQVRRHTELIETLVSDLLEACFDSARVGACRISITKPHMLDRAQGAGAETFMTREDYDASPGARQRRRARKVPRLNGQ